jgi:hypothetical protein
MVPPDPAGLGAPGTAGLDGALVVAWPGDGAKVWCANDTSKNSDEIGRARARYGGGGLLATKPPGGKPVLPIQQFPARAWFCPCA